MGLDVSKYKLITDEDRLNTILKEYSLLDQYSFLDDDVFVLSRFEFCIS